LQYTSVEQWEAG